MGLPTFWKTLFTTFSGIFMIISSVQFSVPTPIQKITKPRIKKEKKFAPAKNTEDDQEDDIVLEDIKDNSRRNIE
ncbi:MAG TPA: hypothetical protein VGC58_00015 [Candidatus Paceibacterota bacterium]